MNDSHSLPNWIAHVFDHPVTETAWHCGDGAPTWEGSPELNITFIAETFEHSGGLLARFTDEELNQVFGYLVSMSSSDFMYALTDSTVPSGSTPARITLFYPALRASHGKALFAASLTLRRKGSKSAQQRVLPVVGHASDRRVSGIA